MHVFDPILEPLKKAHNEALAQLRDLERERDEVSLKISQTRETVRTAESMLRQIDPTLFPKQEKSPPSKSKNNDSVHIGAERVEVAERFVRRWFQEGNDVVRQLDLVLNEEGFNQSSASGAFRRLRELGIIRLVRTEGSVKLYRLTKHVEKEEHAKPEQPTST